MGPEGRANGSSATTDEQPPEHEGGARPPDLLARVLLIVALAILAWLVKSGLPLGELPANADPAQVRTGLAIVIFAGGLWLTEALPLAITALFVPVLAAFTGTLGVREAFSNFAHPLIFLFLAGFGLAAALSRQGIDLWLAGRVLRLAGGRFRPASLALFGISAGLSMWISNTATVAMLLPVTLGLIARIEHTAGAASAQRATPYLLLGIAYSASIGGIGTLVGSPPNAIAAAALDVGFADWLAIGLPFVALLLPSLFVLLPLLTRPGTIPEVDFEMMRFEFDRDHCLTLVLFALTIAAWLASSRLGTALGIEGGLDSVIGVSALVAAVALRLVDWEDIDRTTDWGVLLLFGGGLTLSRVLSVTDAGAYLADRIAGLTTGLPILVVLGLIVLFLIFLTEVSSNTATAALFVPIAIELATNFDLSSKQLAIPVAVACSCAFMLPVATPPNAIVFGSGRLRQRTMMRVGLALNLIFATLISGLAYLLL